MGRKRKDTRPKDPQPAPANGDGATPRRPRLNVEALEPRILMSATWVDADTGDALPEATDGADTFVGSTGADAADGGGGHDILSGRAGEDVLSGGAGNDLLEGGQGDDVLDGGDGDDVLDGGQGDDVLDGGAGDDVLDGGQGADVMHGGLGDDVLDGGSGADVMTGGEGMDHLVGDAGNDHLDGGAGDDFLEGGTGDDVLAGGLGSDVLHGDQGRDVVDYSGAPAAITLDLTLDGVEQDTGGAGTDTLDSIEGVRGTNHGDTFHFSNAHSGDKYSLVLGGGGFGDRIVLENHSAEDATIDLDAKTATIDLERGGHFTISWEGDDPTFVFAEDLADAEADGDDDAPIAADVEARPDAAEVSGDVATTTGETHVTVAAVADAVEPATTGVRSEVNEPLPLDIDLERIDRDGSEVASIRIEGVPAGATLSAGTDNGDGSWTLGPSQLRGLTFTSPPDVHGTYDLHVVATSTERDGGDGATTEATLRVEVRPERQVPTAKPDATVTPWPGSMPAAAAPTTELWRGDETLDVLPTGGDDLDAADLARFGIDAAVPDFLDDAVDAAPTTERFDMIEEILVAPSYDAIAVPDAPGGAPRLELEPLDDDDDGIRPADGATIDAGLRIERGLAPRQSHVEHDDDATSAGEAEGPGLLALAWSLIRGLGGTRREDDELRGRGRDR